MVREADLYCYICLNLITQNCIAECNFTVAAHERAPGRLKLSNGDSAIFLAVFFGHQRWKHHHSILLVPMERIHRWPMDSTHNVSVIRKVFPCQDIRISWLHILMKAILFWWTLFHGFLLTFWHQSNIAAIVRMSRFRAFSWNASFPLWFKIHWSLFIRSNWEYLSTGSWSVLTLNRRQVIAWTYEDPLYWRINAPSRAHFTNTV